MSRVYILTPADEYWPAYVEGGTMLHTHDDSVELCDPRTCCVVASTDGLIEEIPDADQ